METVNTSPLFSYAAAAALSNGSLYRDRTRDRDELLAFMDGKLPYTTGRQGMDVRYVPPEKQF